MIHMLQKRFALSRQGARDLIRGCIACVLQDISFMFPVGLLYFFVIDLMEDGIRNTPASLYVLGVCACLIFIFAVTRFQYNATYLATYVESGVRRISLAEQLRRIPLSFFGKKDLADLTNSIMSDCTTLEQAFSHYVPGLAGSLISTALIGICLFFFDWRMALAAIWRMALAAIWVLPVAFAITLFSARIQEYFNRKSVAANVALEEGVQECIESLRDLKSCCAEQTYLQGLDRKIDYAENRHIISELGTALFVVSSTLPDYLFGLIILYIFGYTLGWFPTYGAYDITTPVGFNLQFIGDCLYHGFLPICAYVFTGVGAWALSMKGSSIGVLGEDYVGAGIARGLPERVIVKKYLKKNARLPLVTSLALSFATLFGGSAIMENIFAYPGIGYAFSSYVASRDYFIMQGLFFFMSVVIILANLIADSVYTLIDPRIRRGV